MALEFGKANLTEVEEVRMSDGRNSTRKACAQSCRGVNSKPSPCCAWAYTVALVFVLLSTVGVILACKLTKQPEIAPSDVLPQTQPTLPHTIGPTFQTPTTQPTTLTQAPTNSESTPEDRCFELLGKFCRANGDSEDHGQWKSACGTRKNKCKQERCREICLRVESCTGYEYSTRLRQDGVACEIHADVITSGLEIVSATSRDYCYKKLSNCTIENPALES